MTAQLGKKYRDTISGYVGVATSITEYLYGCRRIGLNALVEGEPKEFLFDEPGLELVESEQRPAQQDTGGPHGYGSGTRA
jgi:hypothetical protein